MGLISRVSSRTYRYSKNMLPDGIQEPSSKRRKIEPEFEPNKSNLTENFSDLSLETLSEIISSDDFEIDEQDIPKFIPEVSEFLVKSFDKDEKSIETECGRQIFIQGQWDL